MIMVARFITTEAFSFLTCKSDLQYLQVKKKGLENYYASLSQDSVIQAEFSEVIVKNSFVTQRDLQNKLSDAAPVEHYQNEVSKPPTSKLLVWLLYIQY